MQQAHVDRITNEKKGRDKGRLEKLREYEQHYEAIEKKREGTNALQAVKDEIERKKMEKQSLEDSMRQQRDAIASLEASCEDGQKRKDFISEKVKQVEYQITQNELNLRMLRDESSGSRASPSQEIQEAEREMNRLAKRHQFLMEEKRQLERDWNDVQSKLNMARDLFNQSDRLCIDKNEQLMSLQRSLDSVLAEEERAKRQLNENEDAHSDSVRNLKKIEEQNERTKRSVAEARERDRFLEAESRKIGEERNLIANLMREKERILEMEGNDLRNGNEGVAKAAEAVSRSKANLNSIQQSIREQQTVLMNNLSFYDAAVEKRKEAEQEIVTGESLLSQVRERQEMIGSELDSISSKQPSIQSRISQLKSRIEELKGLSARSKGSIEALESTMAALLKNKKDLLAQRETCISQLSTLHLTLVEAKTKYQKSENDRLSCEALIAQLEKRLRSDVDLGDELTRITMKIRELAEETKRDGRAVEEAELELQELKGRLKEAWKELHQDKGLCEQLNKEAEAVMRAEAAIALEQKQCGIRRDASEMASLKMKQTTHIMMDDEATNVSFE